MQNSRVSPPYPSAQQDFMLDNFRLPPGITLTRVQGTTPPVHPELPMRMVDRTKRESNSNSATNTSPPGPNPIIVTSPLSAPKTKESLGKYLFHILGKVVLCQCLCTPRFVGRACCTKRNCG